MIRTRNNGYLIGEKAHSTGRNESHLIKEEKQERPVRNFRKGLIKDRLQLFPGIGKAFLSDRCI